METVNKLSSDWTEHNVFTLCTRSFWQVPLWGLATMLMPLVLTLSWGCQADMLDNYVMWTPEKNPPTVDTGLVTFTLLTAVMVVALMKGPLAGTIISCMAEIGWQDRGTRGLWRAILGETWLKWLSASKKIVKIQIHAGPICQTRCCCIPMKGNVIVEPGFPRECAGGLDN